MLHLRNHNRTGATLVEFIAAGAILATVMSFIVPFVSRVALINQNVADREFALREVQNAITLLQTGNPEVTLSEGASQRLPDSELQVQSTWDDAAGLQRVEVSLTWTGQFDERVAPVSLVFWEAKRETK